MARSSKVIACMFCQAVPCECNKPAKPKREAKPKPRPKKEAAPKSERIVTDEPKDFEPPPDSKRVSVREAMKAKAAAKKATSPAPQPVVEQVPQEDEAILHSAIRALGSLLHPTEKRKYADILNAEPAVSERAAAWKARRRGQGARLVSDA